MNARRQLTNVEEDTIERVVHEFYSRIQEDDVLGPIFDSRIDNWDEHLATMVDFWSSILNTTGRYRGNPPAVHAAVSAIEPWHFARWLKLFHATTDELCSEEEAAQFQSRSQRMAQVLSAKLAEYRRANAAL
jgi:hemoglobin